MVTGVGWPSIKSSIVAAGHQLSRFAPKAGPTTARPITNATVAPMAVWMTANARARNVRRRMSSGFITARHSSLQHDSRHHDETGACQAQPLYHHWRHAGQQRISPLTGAERQNDFRNSEPFSIHVGAREEPSFVA